MHLPHHVLSLVIRSSRLRLGPARAAISSLLRPSSIINPYGLRLLHHAITIPSESPVSDLRDVEMMHPPSETLVGQSGRRYVVERVLQDKGPPLGRVCLATYVPLTRKMYNC